MTRFLPLVVLLLAASIARADIRPTGALRVGPHASSASLQFEYDKSPIGIGPLIEVEGGLWVHPTFGVRAFGSYARFKVKPQYEDVRLTTTFSTLAVGVAVMWRPRSRVIVDASLAGHRGSYATPFTVESYTGVLVGARVAIVLHQAEAIGVQLSAGLAVNRSDDYEDKLLFQVPVLLGVVWN